MAGARGPLAVPGLSGGGMVMTGQQEAARCLCLLSRLCAALERCDIFSWEAKDAQENYKDDLSCLFHHPPLIYLRQD